MDVLLPLLGCRQDSRLISEDDMGVRLLSVTPTITTSAYNAGDCVGGVQTVPGALLQWWQGGIA